MMYIIHMINDAIITISENSENTAQPFIVC